MSKMAIVGCDASGKTVLISSISDYYRAGTRPDQSCIMVPAAGTTRRYTDTLHRVMRLDGEWPEATSDIAGNSTLRWNIVRNGRTLAELELMDFGGENFRYAFRDDGTDKNHEIVARLKAYIAGADFVVITVSMDKMLRNLTPSVYRQLEQGDVEYDRDAEAQWITDGLLRLVADRVVADPPGVVVALTQADKHRKELEEFGSAKALFSKCWPSIAAVFPSLTVVPCASIDRMSSAGLPAEGYSTAGILEVMKEFARSAFGDVEPLFARLDELERTLGGLDEVEHPKAFVETFSAYRKAFDELGDRTAIVSERYADLIRPRAAFIADNRSRFAVAERAEKARILEEGCAAAARMKQEAEEQRKRDAELERKAQRARALLHRFKIVLLIGAMAAILAVGALLLVRHPQPKVEATPAVATTNAVTTPVVVATNAVAPTNAVVPTNAVAATKATTEAKARAEETKSKVEEAKVREAKVKEAKARAAEAEARAAKARAEAEAKAAAHAAAQAEARMKSEISGRVDGLVMAVNGANLEQGKKLIAELSVGKWKLTDEQKNRLNYAKAFMDHLEKAGNGNADDMVWIGNQFYTAKDPSGVIRNPSVAYEWYRKASSADSAQAYYFLSLMAEQGEGCRKDETLAGRYCLTAARRGNREAMFWTGVYFRAGSHGFEKSPATALKFFLMARNAGFSNANLEKLIQSVRNAGSETTIDERYPDNPLEPPVPPAEKSGHWWSFGF